MSKVKTRSGGLIPKSVPRDEFNRILGNLTKATPIPRKDRTIAAIVKAGKPTPKPER